MNLSFKSSHKRIQEGDIKEFEKIFKQLYNQLCLYANKYLKDADSSEEVVQELFYHYWKNREKIDITTSLKAYLFQATRNRALKTISHNTVREKYSNEIRACIPTFDYQDEDVIETKELKSVIDNTLNQLPNKCREIFELSRFEGMKYQEIADKLSISVKTVEANMGRALKLFRANLKDYNKLTC